ncbi:FCS-Like Zinc finger 6 isoform X2 [Rhodamnia argentea]|uniref:FCS-Like Zinc finger 6 isoform X2 n=1 Tax=Rhodamnia argentea TaxID=178133 RepID=A0ABM3HIH1_9MYRT|nr:FCS-Like Zinc finger 6 isoform X2 [Rhodamnia argentea]
MLLGKRPRHRIQRTTSVTSITVVDLDVDDPQEPPSEEDASLNPPGEGGQPRAAAAPDHHGGVESIDMDRQSSFLALVSPRNYSSMEAGSAHFLTTCGLCKRRLFPGRDIYMYSSSLALSRTEKSKCVNSRPTLSHR